jgi:hypothetical protein
MKISQGENVFPYFSCSTSSHLQRYAIISYDHKVQKICLGWEIAKQLNDFFLCSPIVSISFSFIEWKVLSSLLTMMGKL